MMTTMKNNIVKTALILLAGLSFVSCDLTEPMQVQADKAMIFGSESGLKTYSYSFYTDLPSIEDAFLLENGKVDYVCVRKMNNFYIKNAYNAETSTSWSWGTLRNINYFLDGLKSKECVVDAKTKAHYEGLGRWFRAWFYFDKLTTYGEVPWFDKELQNYELDLMYKNRDSRDVIVSNIISDLDFAYENIQTTSSIGSSLVSKWAAAAFKSRVCLFEASFRKYHGITGELTAEALFEEAAKAAQLVMDGSGHTLNTAKGSNGAYRDLFTSNTLLTNEVILGVNCNVDASIYGNQNWRFNSASYGNGYCPSRAFVNTFMMKDGTCFTDKPNYSATSFADEFVNRDERLAQIVRSPEYKLDGQPAPADIVTTVAVSGYHMIKFCIDKNILETKNPNGVPLIRYAEVLLNYAEAKAELGKLTAADWAKTIGAIRARAGIVGGLDQLPTKVDPYMQQTFYPDVTDPVIMEIRRERAIELFFEGQRLNDLRRWKCGKLIETLPWTGIHIPALDTPIDINGDGTVDYYFTKTPKSQAVDPYKNVWIPVDQDPAQDGIWAVPNPAGGYDLEFRVVDQRCWYDDDRQYLYPIPAKVIRDYEAEGYTLSQNKNW